MKKIAVLYYSQTGQTLDLIKSVLSKIPPSVQVDYYPIEPKEPYPFPWSKDEFLSVMPECVLPCVRVFQSKMCSKLQDLAITKAIV
ncbi:MAG TPA: hypothetical protein VI959_03035 [Alphaproteobacteria bacterium]|nr:hypothetical protein [Alphaproteobacteria bacterium]